MTVTRPNEEHAALRDVVRRFLADRSSDEDVRRLVETGAVYDADAWVAMAEQIGLQGLAIPERHGGSGSGLAELAIVSEEMGAALLCAPYFSTVALAAELVCATGDEAAMAELLPPIASGRVRATVAVVEDGGEWSQDGVQAIAVRHGEGHRVTGRKMFVPDGVTADVLIVAARTEAGVTLFMVDGVAPGITRTGLEVVDLTRPQARVHFDGVEARRVGGDGAGWVAVARMLDRARVLLAAEQVGAARRCLERAVEYSKLRRQFGRPIGSFQAIKHTCADMLLAVEMAAALTGYAVRAVEGVDAASAAAPAVALAGATEAFSRVVEEAIQVHGGIGFTWEHPAHLYFRRSRSAAVLLGRSQAHLDAVADALGVGGNGP